MWRKTQLLLFALTLALQLSVLPVPTASQVSGISGTVTEEASGAPLEGLYVILRDADGFDLGGALTDAAGRYTFTPLGPGSYFVSVVNVSGYIDEIYDDVPCPGGRCTISIGDPIPVVQDTVTTGIDFALEPGGVISGTVTDESTGDPIPNISLRAYDAQGNGVLLSLSAVTDANGNYSAVGLPTGTYFVKANPSSGLDYDEQYYDVLYEDIPCWRCDTTSGAPIAVTAPDETPDIDFVLTEAGTLSGRVTEADTGRPVARETVVISVRDVQGTWHGFARPAADGTYTALSLPPIDVYVRTSGSFADELYDDVACPGLCAMPKGMPISIEPGADTPGVDFALEPEGTIKGVVTDASTGLPIGGVTVAIFDTAGNLICIDVTKLDGRYSSIVGLTPGHYFAATINFSGYEDELFDDLPCVPGDCELTTGTPIPVVAFQTTAVDFSLELGSPASTSRVLVRASSEGVLDPASPNLAGAEAAAEPEPESLADDIYRLDRELQATAAALAAHDVPATPRLQDSLHAFRTQLLRLRKDARAFDPSETRGFLPEIDRLELSMRNLDLAHRGGLAPPVSIPRSEVASSTGVVEKGAPANDDCADATVIGNGAFVGETFGASNDGESTCDSSVTARDIWFRYVAPADGEINVNTRGSSSNTVLSVHTGCPGTTANEVACDATTFVDGTSSVDLGFVTAGSEFLIRVGFYSNSSGPGAASLNVGPATGIAGTVTEESSASPLAGISTRIRDENGFYIARVTTDALGKYQVAGLDPDTYFVNTSSIIGLIDEIHDDVPCTGGDCSVTIGDPIAVNQDTLTTGVDFALAAGGSISGTVTDAGSGNPLTNTFVQIYDDQGRIVDRDFTDTNGTYSTPAGLATGSYFVWAASFENANELFDDIVCLNCDRTTGTPVAITAPVETSGIDFALDFGGSISGTVTRESNGDPVQTSVRVHDAHGDSLLGASTFPDGSYRIGGLPTGSYFVLSDSTNGWVDELYDHVLCPSRVCDLEAGTPVAVSLGKETSGIDLALEGGASIQGRVMDASTGEPLVGVIVNIFDASGRLVSAAPTSFDGTYLTLGLPAGNYFATTINYSRYEDELYDHLPCPTRSCDPTTGMPIPWISDQRVDFALSFMSDVFADGFESGDTSAWSLVVP